MIFRYECPVKVGTSKVWDSQIDYWLYKTQAKEENSTDI